MMHNIFYTVVNLEVCSWWHDLSEAMVGQEEISFLSPLAWFTELEPVRPMAAVGRNRSPMHPVHRDDEGTRLLRQGAPVLPGKVILRWKVSNSTPN